MFPALAPITRTLIIVNVAVFELALGVFGTQQGVAHFAHLGGMAAGYLLVLYWRHGPRRR
jgi:membrane associated rhomboid family serine protease